MKIIKLTQKKSTLVDDDFFDGLSKFAWYAIKRRGAFYATTHSSAKNRRLLLMHRFIMGEPNGRFIDHKNGDTLDNRKENLRICTSSENSKNQKLRVSSHTGFKGVSWHKRDKVFAVQIGNNKKKIHLGYFDNIKDAASAYNEAALKYHGEFARLNIINK